MGGSESKPWPSYHCETKVVVENHIGANTFTAHAPDRTLPDVEKVAIEKCIDDLPLKNDSETELPETVQEELPERTPKELPERLAPEEIPERPPEKITPKELPERSPEELPEKTPEELPERPLSEATPIGRMGSYIRKTFSKAIPVVVNKGRSVLSQALRRRPVQQEENSSKDAVVKMDEEKSALGNTSPATVSKGFTEEAKISQRERQTSGHSDEGELETSDSETSDSETKDSERSDSEEDIATPQEMKDEIKTLMKVLSAIDGSKVDVSGSNRQWILAVQTRVLILHSKDSIKSLDVQLLLESVSRIGMNLSDKEFFKLCQALCSLYSQPSENIQPPPTLSSILSSNSLCNLLWGLTFVCLQENLTKPMSLPEFFAMKSKDIDIEQILARAVATSELSPQDAVTLLHGISKEYIPPEYSVLWALLQAIPIPDIPLKMSPMIKKLAQNLKGKFRFEVSPCSLHSLHELLHTMIDDTELAQLLTDTVATTLWYPTQVFVFLQEVKLPLEKQKELLNLILVHRLPWFAAQDAYRSTDFVASIKSFNGKMLEKELDDLIHEIAEPKLLDDAILTKTKAIVQHALDKKQSDVSSDDFTKVLKRAEEGQGEDLSLVVVALCDAVQKTKHSYPTKTQMAALSILILSSIHKDKQARVNQLLEVLPGEGAPCIISMLAVALAVLGRKVDIIASSPAEAEKSIQEWAGFYQAFSVAVASNTGTLNPSTKNDDRKVCYRCPVVYGTVSSFAADLLREQFEMESVREGRPCQALLISQGYCSMVDDALQFTQLSRCAPDLQHIEPVLALVWSSTSAHTALHTTNSEKLYAAPPSYFHSIIMQCVGKFKEPKEVLQYAVENAIISEDTMMKFNEGDQEEKKKVMESIDTQTVIDLFMDLGECCKVQFYLYTMDDHGLLQHEINTPFMSTQFSILVNGGTCSALYTHKELMEGVSKQVLSCIQFSDEQALIEKTVQKVKEMVSKFFQESTKLSNSLDKMLQGHSTAANKDMIGFQEMQFTEIASQAVSAITADSCLKHLVSTTAEACQTKSDLTQESRKVVESLLAKYEETLSHYCEKLPLQLPSDSKTRDSFVDSASKVFMRLIENTLLQNRVEIPEFVKTYVTDQLPHFVECALKAMEMMPDREYVIHDGQVQPVDFQSSGIIQTSNRKFKGSLQQMLQMKHKLVVSPMTVATNFMSNVEFFTKYELLCGIIDTVDLSSDPYTFQKLYNAHICKIPTLKPSKLHEKQPVVVRGSKDTWFEQICKSLDYEVHAKSWKKDRAALVICEDVYTAKELHGFIRQKHKEWKISLFTGNDSKAEGSQSFLGNEMQPKSIIISTNIASHSTTEITVSQSVNENGGLFCIFTFLANSCHVEMNGFRQAGQKGNPGSMQLIIPSFSLPSEWQKLDVVEVRRLRDQKRFVELKYMIENCVPQTMLKGRLLHCHCEFIKDVHKQLSERSEATRRVILDSINERWGKWLDTKASQIQNLEADQLMKDLFDAHTQWKLPHFDSTDTVLIPPGANMYTVTKLGNLLLEAENNEENAEIAAKYYTKAIQIDARNATAAYYNRAYCFCVTKSDNYLECSIKDMKTAREAMSHLVDAFSSLLCACTNSSLEDSGTSKIETRATLHQLKIQIQARLHLLSLLGDHIDKAGQKLKELKDKDDDADSKSESVFHLVSKIDNITQLELYGLVELGFEAIFTIEEHKTIWGFLSGLAVLALGVLEVAAGACLTILSGGSASSIGMYLMSEGISDSIDGCIGMYEGEFSWKQWGIAKATNLLISIVTGGIGSFLKGPAILAEGISEAAEVAEDGWRAAFKNSLRATTKHIVKDAATQLSLRALGWIEEEALEKFAQAVANQLSQKIQPSIKKSFHEGKLGAAVEQFVNRKPQPAISEQSDSYYASLCQETSQFFDSAAQDVFISISHESEMENTLQQMFFNYSERIEGKLKGLIDGIDDILAVLNVSETVEKMATFQTEFLPDVEEEVTKQLDSPGSPHRSSSLSSLLEKLKDDMTGNLTKIFANLMKELIMSGVDATFTHKLNKGFNRLAAEKLGKVLRVEHTLKEIKAGEHANRIAHGAIVTESSTIHSADVSAHAQTIQNEDIPGTMLEMRAYAEHSSTRIIVVNENGKKLRSISPSSGKADKTITLRYKEPDEERHPNGHYDPVVNGKVQEITPKDGSSCMFESIAVGVGQEEHEAKSIRKAVAEELTKSPEKWHDFVTRRYEVDEVSKGKSILMTGAGVTIDEGTRYVESSVKRTVTTNEEGNTVENGEYKEKNKIEVTYNREFDRKLVFGKLSTKGTARIISKQWGVKRLEVTATGLKFRGKGRCWKTGSSEGSIQLAGTLPHEQPVSFHVISSAAGLNAGWESGNSVTTSAAYNRKELELHEKQRQFTEGKSFTCKAVVELEPLEAILSTKKFSKSEKAEWTRRFEAIRRKDPTARRVKKITWTLTNHKGEELKLTMGRDEHLYMPKKLTKSNNDVIKGKARRKIYSVKKLKKRVKRSI